jgi:biotin synthase-like enzyme
MNPLITYAAKEVASTIVINLAWKGYKEYCMWCWQKFYLTKKK